MVTFLKVLTVCGIEESAEISIRLQFDMSMFLTNYMEHLSLIRFLVARFGRGERRMG